jgi:hypothetical protein
MVTVSPPVPAPLFGEIRLTTGGPRVVDARTPVGRVGLKGLPLVEG